MKKELCGDFLGTLRSLQGRGRGRRRPDRPPEVRPDHPGPYLAPKTAEDAADASDDPVDVPDVLEAGNFGQKLVRILPDAVGAGHVVLEGIRRLWRQQKLHKVDQPSLFF